MRATATPRSDGQAKLVVEGLGKVFPSKSGPVRALDDVNVVVRPGDFLTLIGHSGCGKSTFLNIVAGLVEASEGRILVDGVARRSPGRDRGMVFQSYTLYPWLSVARNVAFGPRMRGLGQAEQREIALQYLQLVGLAHVAEAYPKELSGGMRQRVPLARALANKPAILLMDEPFGALDAETRETMQNLLLEIRAKEFMTVLFVTHDLDEAVLLSERIGIMSARPGRIVDELDVELPYPRDVDVKLSDRFIQIKRRLVDHFRSAKSHPA